MGPRRGIQSPFTRKTVGGFGHRGNLNLPTSTSPTVASVTDRVEKFRFSADPSVLKNPKVSATATFTLSDKPDEASTITLVDSNSTSVTFEIDNENDGVSDSNVAIK